MNLASTNNKKQRRFTVLKPIKYVRSKRDDHKEPVMFDKITDRIKLCYLNLVDAVKSGNAVIEGLYDGVSTSELDNLAAETQLRIAHQIMHN
jgi:hypothetical protein